MSQQTRRATVLGGSVLAALIAFPALALANAGPALPWREPLPVQASVIAMLFVISAGVALFGWWMLRRVERTARKDGT